MRGIAEVSVVSLVVVVVAVSACSRQEDVSPRDVADAFVERAIVARDVEGAAELVSDGADNVAERLPGAVTKARIGETRVISGPHVTDSSFLYCFLDARMGPVNELPLWWVTIDLVREDGGWRVARSEWDGQGNTHAPRLPPPECRRR